MILVIDNYDSFTFNLAQYLGELQAEVEVRRNDQITLDRLERERPSKGMARDQKGTRQNSEMGPGSAVP